MTSKGPNDQQQALHIAERLQRAVEITELCLDLRCAALRARHPNHGGMEEVMREIRAAKDEAWRRNRA
jgi:hypothetical protein